MASIAVLNTVFSATTEKFSAGTRVATRDAMMFGARVDQLNIKLKEMESHSGLGAFAEKSGLKTLFGGGIAKAIGGFGLQGAAIAAGFKLLDAGMDKAGQGAEFLIQKLTGTNSIEMAMGRIDALIRNGATGWDNYATNLKHANEASRALAESTTVLDRNIKTMTEKRDAANKSFKETMNPDESSPAIKAQKEQLEAAKTAEKQASEQVKKLIAQAGKVPRKDTDKFLQNLHSAEGDVKRAQRQQADAQRKIDALAAKEKADAEAKAKQEQLDKEFNEHWAMQRALQKEQEEENERIGRQMQQQEEQEFRGRQQRAEAIRKDIQSPLEAFEEKMRMIQGALDFGDISQEQFDAAKAKELAALNSSLPDSNRRAGLVEFGSQAAFAAMADTPMHKTEKEILAEAEKQTELQKQMVEKFANTGVVVANF